MKLRQLTERLLQFDQDCEVKIIAPNELTLGSVYDDTNPMFNRKPAATPSVVTIELDPV